MINVCNVINPVLHAREMQKDAQDVGIDGSRSMKLVRKLILNQQIVLKTNTETVRSVIYVISPAKLAKTYQIHSNTDVLGATMAGH